MFEDAKREEEALPALQRVDADCPHCGEVFEVCVDPREEGQEMSMNCPGCCRNVQLAVEVEGEDVSVSSYSF